MHFTIYLLIGAFSGLLAGGLGIGGGVVIVPALATLFSYFAIMPNEHVMHMAIGTSLATLVSTLLASLYSHVKRRSVQWHVVGLMLPGLILGIIVGALVAKHLNSHYLKIFFSFFLLVIAGQLFFEKSREIQDKNSLPAAFIIIPISAVIGFLSGILGIGGGILIIPFLLYCRLDLREATGTSVACGVSIGLVASISYMILGASTEINVPWSTGFIYWPAFLGVSVTSVLFAPIGTALAYKMPTLLLKRVLAIFLILVAIDMMVTQ